MAKPPAAAILYNWIQRRTIGTTTESARPTAHRVWVTVGKLAHGQSIICFPYFKQGLINPDFRPERPQIESWEQRSCPLEVSKGYQKLFTLFARHFMDEMTVLNDPTLEKEMAVLDQLKGKKSDKRVDDWKVE